MMLGFWLTLIISASVRGVIFLIVSLVLLLIKSRKERLNQKKNKVRKTLGIIFLVLGIGLQLPLGLTWLLGAFSAQKREVVEKAKWESIENKVLVDKNWPKGFIYNGDELITVPIFSNSDNYSIVSQGNGNLTQIGSLVFSEDYYTNNFYQLVNNSGFDLYYVWKESFANGEHYSRTFVKKEDFDAVLDYYNQAAGYTVSVLWKSAPERSSYPNNWTYLAQPMDDNLVWLLPLCHEVLDDVANKKISVVPLYNNMDYCDDYMNLNITSKDSVFTIGISFYTQGEDLYLYLNDYKVEDEIVDQYREQILELIAQVKEEML
jgi:hypothetical protein